MKDNISLIGFMGSGKTTIGQILANEMNYLFFDLDRIIELSEGKTINEIFKSEGESYFRDIESKIIKKIFSNKHCVFACGGGVVLRGENMDIINKKSLIVFLEISPREALKRLEDSSERPLLKEKNREATIKNLIKQRKILYSKYADIIINNTDISPDKAADTILKKFKN